MCRREGDFVEALTRIAPQAVTVTRELGEEVDIDSVIKRKYEPIGGKNTIRSYGNRCLPSIDSLHLNLTVYAERTICK